MSTTELFEHYLALPNPTASETTFRRCLAEWTSAGKLRFRKQKGQHARCGTCCKHQEERRVASTSTERESASRRYQQHIAGVLADRSIDAKNDQIIENALAHGMSPRCLKLDIDGMDQSKFMLPRLAVPPRTPQQKDPYHSISPPSPEEPTSSCRTLWMQLAPLSNIVERLPTWNTNIVEKSPTWEMLVRHPTVSSSKAWESYWRPRVHVACVCIAGLDRMFFFSHENTRKGASLEMSMVMMAIDHAAKKLGEMNPPRELPSELILKADNTSKEMKNQFSLLFAAALVASGRMSACTIELVA